MNNLRPTTDAQQLAVARLAPEVAELMKLPTSKDMPEIRRRKDLVLAAADAITAKVSAEKRALSDVENDAFEGLMAFAHNLTGAYNNEVERGIAARHFDALQGRATVGGGEIWTDREGRTYPLLDRETRVADRIGGAAAAPGAEIALSALLRAKAGMQREADRRSLGAASDPAGGYAVPARLAAEIIDLARAKATLIRAGMMTLPIDVGEMSWARLASDPGTSWHGENAVIPDSTDPTFERLTVIPKTLVSLIRISRELLEDAANVEPALRAAFAESIALEIDRVGLFGTGAGQPVGLINATDVLSFDMGAAAGGAVSWDDLLDALQLLLDANSAEPTAAIMAPRTQIGYAKLKDGEGQYLPAPALLARVPFLTTTQIPVNDTHGAAVNASRLFLGDFTQMILTVRTELRIDLLKERYAEYGQYAFLAWLRADFLLRQETHLLHVDGIIP